jgi:ornithine cyclodeaminase/alanine dehydrogenase-like protein (mu-crystallin family)
MRLLTEDDVRACVDLDVVLDRLTEGFIGIADGRVGSIPRTRLDTATGGYMLQMIAEMPGWGIGMKIAAIFPHLRLEGLPTHAAVATLFDERTGQVLALMNGTVLGAVRTAAATVLSIRAAARPDPGVVAILGGGIQARTHMEVVSAVVDPPELRVFSEFYSDAQEVAALSDAATPYRRLEDAVSDADVICCCTRPEQPILHASAVREGTHVTSIGKWEVAPDLVAAARVLVESPESVQAPPVGCAELAGMSLDEVVLMGDVLAGREAGRRSDDQLTLYKSMGHAVEDLAIAQAVFERASSLDAGLDIAF